MIYTTPKKDIYIKIIYFVRILLLPDGRKWKKIEKAEVKKYIESTQARNVAI